MPIVYCLVASDALDTPRYVGKTSQNLRNRISNHVNCAIRKPKATYKENWIRSVLERNCSVQGEVLATVATDEEAYELEHNYIELFKLAGHPLTNGSDWGRGFQGYKHTAESIARTAAANTGRKHTDDELEMMRLGQVGRVHTDETKQKMSVAKKDKRLTDSHKENIADAVRGIKRSSDTKQLMSVAQLDAWANSPEERREKVRQYGLANKGRKHSDEARAKMSAARKGKAKTPEHQAKITAANRKRYEDRLAAKAAKRAELDSLFNSNTLEQEM